MKKSNLWEHFNRCLSFPELIKLMPLYPSTGKYLPYRLKVKGTMLVRTDWYANYLHILWQTCTKYQVLAETLWFITLKPSGNYMFQLLLNSKLWILYSCVFVWFSVQTGIISSNSINQLIFTMVRYLLSFLCGTDWVRKQSLNFQDNFKVHLIIQSEDKKGVGCWVVQFGRNWPKCR